jgi:hypothetical protein
MKFLGIPKIQSCLTAAMNNKLRIREVKPSLIQPIGLRLAEKLGRLTNPMMAIKCNVTMCFVGAGLWFGMTNYIVTVKMGMMQADNVILV